MKTVTLAICVLLGFGSIAPAQAAPRVDLSMSNFRYCEGEMCTPVDVGYPRTADGPIGPDNPVAVIDVKRGSDVFWVYRDGFCDSLGCPGHNVIFEDGTAQGVRKGFVAAGDTGKSIRVRITEPVGTTIRYFCSVNNHYETGMTGILNVVG